MRKKEYRRWDYDDETEVVEEQLSLEDHQFDCDHGGGRDTPTSMTTFTHPSVAVTASHIHRKKGHQRVRIKEKLQAFCMSTVILLAGFMAGFQVGVRDGNSRRNNDNSSSLVSSEKQNKLSNNYEDEDAFLSHEPNGSNTNGKPPDDVSVDNIRGVLRRVSETVHRAGTPEGKSMALAIRDLWRSYGLSVRVEQHKTLLTKATGFSHAEVVDRNGTTVYRTSQQSSENNLNTRPMIALSPAADLNGTLIYGHYGRPEDFDFLRHSRILLNRSIALVRFGGPHPSKVAAVASAFGIKGLLFYPDPQDYGPQLPTNAVRSSSLLTLGQIHEYQKHKSKSIIPAHTISPRDAEELLRYVIIGCSHDSWHNGAGEPGIGLAILTELARSLSSSVQNGWKPRRSILFISWDGSQHASSGVSHWLQEHHHEISSRTLAYIDLSRAIRGNKNLHVHSSPVLNSVARKAIARVLGEGESTSSSSSVNQFNPAGEEGKKKKNDTTGSRAIYFSSLLTSDEPSFAFLGNLGIPFIRICLSNSPQGYDYPLFHTPFDTFENFVNSVDPEMKEAKTLGKIILETIVLLSDSSVLPINVEDYVVEIQKAFGNFMSTHYPEDLHKANLSIAYLQAAVMRLEVIGDNFRTEMHNRTVINPEYDTLPVPSPSPRTIKSQKALLHRIMNDKLMEIDRTFLSRTSEVYKHQVLGFTYDMEEISNNGSSVYLNISSSLSHFFPKLKEVLDCGRIEAFEEEEEESRNSEIISISYTRRSRRRFRSKNSDAKGGIGALQSAVDSSICHDWHALGSQRIASLTRNLDAASAVLQSPLLPEESE